MTAELHHVSESPHKRKSRETGGRAKGADKAYRKGNTSNQHSLHNACKPKAVFIVSGDFRYGAFGGGASPGNLAPVSFEPYGFLGVFRTPIGTIVDMVARGIRHGNYGGGENKTRFVLVTSDCVI